MLPMWLVMWLQPDVHDVATSQIACNS